MKRSISKALSFPKNTIINFNSYSSNLCLIPIYAFSAACADRTQEFNHSFHPSKSNSKHFWYPWIQSSLESKNKSFLWNFNTVCETNSHSLHDLYIYLRHKNPINNLPFTLLVKTAIYVHFGNCTAKVREFEQ